MRFLTLLRKELRECLPWILAAAIFFLVLGSVTLRLAMIVDNEQRYPLFMGGGDVIVSYFHRVSVLDGCGGPLMLVSIGLGLALAARQFWQENSARTWGFTLHRSVARQTILWAKLSAAAMALVIPLGAIWTGFYWYACQEGVFMLPPVPRVFVEGWFFLAAGALIYLGTALTSLSTARWYTTKVFGFILAILICVMVFNQWRLLPAFVIIVIGAAALLSQIIDTFLNREF